MADARRHQRGRWRRLAADRVPLGRKSGGHTNAVVTLAFARLRALPRTDVAGCVAGQTLGSVIGVILARVVWGRAVASRAVSFGAIKPGGGHHAAEVLVVEAVSLMVLVIVTTFFLARP
jgi:glycerol uptake facilitator-like aquaporin